MYLGVKFSADGRMEGERTGLKNWHGNECCGSNAEEGT